MRLRIALFLVALATMVAALVVTAQRGNEADDQLISPSEGIHSESAGPVPSPSATIPAPDPLAVLTDVDLAAGLDRDVFASVIADARDGPLADSVQGTRWRERVDADLWTAPVTIGTASISVDNEVTLDLLISHVTTDRQLELRFLPAARALGDVGLQLDVTIDGVAQIPIIDHEGARLLLATTPYGRHRTRLKITYRVPDRGAIIDDGSPAGIGLLAASADVVALGHWLPLVTLESDSGPMQTRGDVGGFPAGVFSLVVRHEGELVTSGLEGPCPTQVVPAAAGCTWARGAGLRDLSAALVTTPMSAEGDGIRVVVPAGVLSDERVQATADEAAAEIAALSAHLGELPWPVTDVVAVPIRPGAAGMEFPGMVWIDVGVWPRDDGGFGSYVLAHELGHQWFYGLVAGSSLSAPVIDEAAAQYLSYVAFADRFGQATADELASEQFQGRWQRAIQDGAADDAPSLPLDQFTTDRSYGSAVYGRGGQAWVDAERATSRPEVLGLLDDIVSNFGLRTVSLQELIARASSSAPTVAEMLVEQWQIDNLT